MLQVGQRMGRYCILREIGRGGMGVVFAAVHVELGSRVAIKVIDSSGVFQPLTAKRFLREARAAAQTRHIHAVNVFDVGIHEEHPYIVMELLDGETLADVLAREVTLTPARVVEIIVPVLSAVAAAHHAGIVHRDVKPANIMLAMRGGGIRHPVLTDFGISKICTERTEGLTDSHSVLGTIQYMAPELTRSAGNASPRSDLYSIGVVLYECVTGQRPFKGTGPYDLMHAIVTGDCPRPTELQAALDPEFEQLVMRAMHRNPAERFASAGEFALALMHFANSKTWAIWSHEFAANTNALDSTAADRLLSHAPTSIERSLLNSTRANESRWRRDLCLGMAGAVLFVAGWCCANASGRPKARVDNAGLSAPVMRSKASDLGRDTEVSTSAEADRVTNGPLGKHTEQRLPSQPVKPEVVLVSQAQLASTPVRSIAHPPESLSRPTRVKNRSPVASAVIEDTHRHKAAQPSEFGSNHAPIIE